MPKLSYESEEPIHGPGEFKPFFRNMSATFRDLHIDIENLVIQDDKVAVRMDISGTHQATGWASRRPGARSLSTGSSS